MRPVLRFVLKDTHRSAPASRRIFTPAISEYDDDQIRAPYDDCMNLLVAIGITATVKRPSIAVSVDNERRDRDSESHSEPGLHFR